ncbi:hypothetical protein LOK49_LG08G01767 [Camellia lanceoleosa]|uniref:Uncharacterized protein n=1 Tax=Camellia lanceoleosa TaxID=1840588 RepID=A0ACC0GNQ8_9ERIC|nr:hypothetical protein LOK49_LG08G01767 [Camellia lanceoleosa]
MSHVKQSPSNDEEEAFVYALHLSTCQILPTALNAAVEMKLFDIVAAGGGGSGSGISAAEIVARLPVAAENPEVVSMVDRMLSLLVCHSLLTCSVRTLEDGSVGERLYGLSSAGEYFVENREGGSLASLFPVACHPVGLKVLPRMKDAIIEGGNQFNKVHGMSIYQYMNIDPAMKEVFNKAMVAISSVTIMKILETYKGFEGLTSLVDVGGGIGRSLTLLVSKYPSLKGINFDLPGVIESAPFIPGIENVGGDMFRAIPKGDAIMMKNILHNWSDEQCLTILRNCYEALPKNGKVIIIDIVLSETPDSSFGAKYATQLDNAMLLQFGGKERTKKEFETLCNGSRFRDFQVFPCAGVFCVIEFYK